MSHSQRLGGYKLRGVSAVRLGIRCLVRPGRCNVPRLVAGGRGMRLPFSFLLPWRGFVLNSARTAVVGNMVRIRHYTLFHNRLVLIGGMDNVHIHMGHRRVIRKLAAAPLAACKPDSAKAEPVVHPAVVAHRLAPIALVEPIMAAVESPIGRRPQRTAVGRRNPRAGNPEVPIASISPVTGRPHQVWLRAHRLLIDRQLWRCDSHIDAQANA